MTEKEIFEHLFEISKQSKDPRGVVSVCLVDDDKILISKPSADDGIYHAEDLLIKEIIKNGITFSTDATLYSTLHPCSKRSNPALKDCASQIIDIGIKKVVFGAKDPKQFEATQKRFAETDIEFRQTKDTEIIRRCALIFNDSLSPDQKDVNLKPLE
ncbi:MAG: hypothetical protein AAB873_01365 [Patescibacteria group bacterium]